MNYDELCELHDKLCEEYNESEDPAILEKIWAIEVTLLYGDFRK